MRDRWPQLWSLGQRVIWTPLGLESQVYPMPTEPPRPRALGAGPGAGESDPERRSAPLPALSLAISPPWRPLLPAQYLGPSSPPRQGWASPDFFPSVSLPECPPLSPTTLHPTPHLKLAAPQEPPAQFPPSPGLHLPPPSAPRTPTPLLPLSHGNANQRPPLLVLGPSQGPGAVAQRPPPTLRSLARPGSHPAWKRDPGKASCLIPASQQLGAAGTLLRHWEPPFTALWNGHHEACLRHLEEGPW